MHDDSVRYPQKNLISCYTPLQYAYVHPYMATVAQLTAGVNRKVSETMEHHHSFYFIDVRVDRTNDSEIRLMQTCSWWKWLKGSLLVAKMCLPQLRVRLRGSAHFGGETCAHKRLVIETDVKTKVIYKECLDLLPLSIVRTKKWCSLLYLKWSSTPRTWHTPSTFFAMKFLVNRNLVPSKFHTSSISLSRFPVHEKVPMHPCLT